MNNTVPIRVVLPYHLQALAKTGAEVTINVQKPVTVVAVIRSLEITYPMLRGAILDHDTDKRRPLIRFFACCEDVSQNPGDKPLPVNVELGQEPLMIVGAIAGG